MTTWWGAARSALLLAALLPAACMRTYAFDPPGSGGGASGSDAGPLGGGNGMPDGGSGNSDASRLHCSGGTALVPLTVKREVPSIMFALDRSSSMKTGLGGANGSNQTRFSVTSKAITDTVGNYGALAQFGYLEFPGTQSDGSCSGPAPGCCAGGLAGIAPSQSNLNVISNKLSMCTMNSFNNCAQADATPTGQALKKSASALEGTGAWLYVVLLTDGPPSPSCPIDQTSDLSVCEQTVHQISSMSSGSSGSATTPISTFVVAIGDIAPDDCLTSMASVGGHPAPAAPFYFTAPTDTAVHPQIDTIVASTICQWDIADSLDSNRPIEVDFNNSTIPPDPTHSNGWDIDRTSGHVTIYGPACMTLLQQLKNSSRSLVIKGCLDTSHPSPQSPPAP